VVSFTEAAEMDDKDPHCSVPAHAVPRQQVWVVLPAYNEEQSLPALLNRIADAMLNSGLVYRIVVVDDGSNDATAQFAENYARHIPLILERHTANMGLGATIRDGLSKACTLADPGDIIVSMDADNSHRPDLIRRMVWSIREGRDVVIASRYRQGSSVRGVPFVRRVLSRAAACLFRVVFPISGVRDYTCGFRAYRASVLQAAFRQYGATFFDQQGFQCMVDILLKLSPMGLVFGEVPMVLRYDLKESVSKMKVGQTVRRTLLLMIRRRFGA
jgi:dolichol-phosphate mannosyltransferase